MTDVESAETVTLTDFLLARIAEDEAVARDGLELYGRWHFAPDGLDADEPYSGGVGTRPGGSDLVDWSGSAAHIARHDPTRVLAECEAKRRIVDFHAQWPVLVESPPDFDFDVRDGTIEATTLRMSKRIAWMTEQEYRNRFGGEPPTTPMLRALATVYADHPDYRDEWRP